MKTDVCKWCGETKYECAQHQHYCPCGYEWERVP